MLLKASPADIRKLCVCVRLDSENSELTLLISQTTPDEHLSTPPPCRWPTLTTLPTLTKFSPFDAASEMLCRSAPPAGSSTPLRPSVLYLSISIVVNITCIQIFCDHLNVIYIFDQTHLYRFELRLELYIANVRVVGGSLPSLSPSHPPTPPPSRWSAFTILPPLAKFPFVWCRLCEALLSSSYLASQKHQSLLSRLSLKCRRYKGCFALNMKIKSSIKICGHEHDHRRRADRAPQITASYKYTPDRRPAHWYI